jgi:3-oxoacyl-[acyl-carrier-protein] synthase II
VESFSTEALGCHVGAPIDSFQERKYLGTKNLRPLDRTSRLVAATAKLALENSGWSAELLTRYDVGLALGTMFCSVHTIAEFDRRAMVSGPEYASPMDFANTVINAAAGQTAIWHGLRGVNSTICADITSGLQAIAYATELIRNGRATALLAGGADEFCFESFYGFARAGLSCGSQGDAEGVPIPFSARRNGLALGEGAALLMLEEAEFASARGARVIGEVKGHGAGYDRARGRDRDESVRSVARAIRLALEDAGIGPEQVDCLSASANGSVAADRHEALGVQAALNGRARSLPVTAIKSMLGETLGASAAMQTVTLLESIRQGLLPGIRQLEETEPDFPLALAGPDNRQVPLRNGLINAVGLDGNCCSLIVMRES